MRPPAAVVAGQGPVTLVGGGPLADGDLRAALALAPALVAADGGAGACLNAGLIPLAVIGDMDSLPPDAARTLAGRLHRVAEQDSTDFDKALSRIDAPLVIGLGFAGGRLDHELAALHALVARAQKPCLILGPETLALHCPPALDLPLAAGTTVSLFPLLPVRVTSRGLRWPTDGLLLSPRGRIGTSNAALGPVTLRPLARGLLVILPRSALELAAHALRAAPRWPARAR